MDKKQTAENCSLRKKKQIEEKCTKIIKKVDVNFFEMVLASQCHMSPYKNIFADTKKKATVTLFELH